MDLDFVGIILFVFIVLLYTCQSLFSKFFGDGYPGKSEMVTPIFAVSTGLFVAITSFAFAGFHFELSWQVVLLGILNGFILLLYDFSLLGSSKYGPYSIVMVFNVAGGIIIPSLFSWLMFDTPFKISQALCIVAVLISVYLISIKGNESFINKPKFFLWCFLLFTANGLYCTILKFQQYYSGLGYFPNEEKGLVAITYSVTAISSLLLMLKNNGVHSIKAFGCQNKKSLIFLIVSCIICTSAINIYMYIIPFVNFSLLCTYENSCILMLSFLSSVVFFKDKAGWKNIIGCIIACIALICISIL